MSFSYTTSDETEINRIERRLRAEGVRFRKVQTQPRTFTDDEEEVTVGTARPWNLIVAKKHAKKLRAIIDEKHDAQGV